MFVLFVIVFSSNHVELLKWKIYFQSLSLYIFFHNFRSPYVTREARTLADKPEMPPNMTLGSFEAVSHDIQKRTVYVYWRQIPDYNQNGPNFRYSVTEVIIESIRDLNFRQGKNKNKTWSLFFSILLRKLFLYHFYLILNSAECLSNLFL